MDKNPQKYLEHIMASINNIEQIVQKHPKRFDYFCSDVCYNSAIKYQIAIIGEAMNQLKKVAPEISITNSRKIIDTRNYIIHAYDSLNNDILWSIVINHLDNLKKEISSLLINH